MDNWIWSRDECFEFQQGCWDGLYRFWANKFVFILTGVWQLTLFIEFYGDYNGSTEKFFLYAKTKIPYIFQKLPIPVYNGN